jgi:hypothetical protein
MRKYIVRGRSEDGLMYWMGIGWAHEKRAATRLTETEAEDVIALQRVNNKQGGPDAFRLYQLTIVEL